jgi:endonuclease/exonuclease/phosphatase family metal-dependent hydrolase
MQLRVATYNVHQCVGRDGRRDAQRVAAVLDEIDADVLALQELQWDPKEALHLLADFAEQLGYQPVAGPTLLQARGHYGNALLTRLPVLHEDLLDLSVNGHEPRGAIDVVLDANGQRVRVLATHLGLRPYERRHQMRRLLAQLDRGPAQVPTVLMGDLNEWFLWGRPLRWLHARFGATPAPATFPSALPLFALDRIWVRPRKLLARLFVHSGRQVREASDHLPVIAQLAA